jgi:hypothetical protein
MFEGQSFGSAGPCGRRRGEEGRKRGIELTSDYILAFEAG